MAIKQPEYAQKTTVSTEKSRAEIERTLQRYGAEQFMYGWEAERALIAFKAHGRQIRFVLPMPEKKARKFTHTNTGKARSEATAYKEWEQSCRARWRSLALVIKAKLEAVEAGIAIFEDEFMANIMLPDGHTVSQFMLPQIDAAYKQGKMPTMLPLLES